MKLYEIGGQMTQIENELDDYAREHMGDITDFPVSQSEYYEMLTGERDEKLLNLASWFKSLKAEAEAYKTEMQTLAQKKKTIENKMQWIKDFIITYLKGGEKIKDTRAALSWRKSQKLDIDDDKFDIRDLEEEYRVVSVDPDKTKLKEAIKGGMVFENIRIVENENLKSSNMSGVRQVFRILYDAITGRDTEPPPAMRQGLC